MPAPTLQAPALAPDPPLFIVFNPGSGRGDAEEVRTTVEAACRDHGRACHWFLVGGQARPPALAAQAVAAARAAGGIVVAAGGDGTLNAVANVALPAGCAFGVLPQGTFNYFGRDHGIPTDTAEAIAALLAGRPRAEQAGLVNDRLFLVNASLGLYARALADREAAKARFGRSRVVAAFAALGTLLRGFRPWPLHLVGSGHDHLLRTPTLFVGNNALQFEQVGVAEGETVEQGSGLTAIAPLAVSRLGMLRLMARAAFGRLDDDPGVQTFSFTELRAEGVGRRWPRRVRVAVDGEVTRMAMPLVFRVAPQPLWLVAPPPELEQERA